MEKRFLVLSRREGQSIQVGQDCVVTVQRIRGEHVRLLFSAPDSVQIVRDDAKRTEPRRDAA